MNNGTRIRLALSIISAIGVVILIFVPLQMLLKIFIGIVIIVTLAVNHWYNNDYSEEHCRATGRARVEKKERKHPDFIGERFFEDFDGIKGELDDEQDDL